MLRTRHLLGLLVFLWFASVARPGEQPLYDEKADAHQQIAAALAQASKSHKRVVLVFGANW